MSSCGKCGLGSLDEDSVAHILSYLDFDSALRWKKVVDDDKSRLLTDFGGYGVVWRESMRRQGFAPPFTTKQDVNATISECLHRKKLELNLFGQSGTTTTAIATSNLNSLSVLPNRHYSFLPVTPEEWDDLDDDAPPVPFSCDCFALTSAGVGGEFLLLNPFSQSLTVYDSLVLKNHHQVGQTTSNNPVFRRVEHQHDDDEEALASAVQQATLSSSRKGSLGSETEGNSSQEEDNHDLEDDEPNEDGIDDVDMAQVHHHRPRLSPQETLISWQDDVLDADLFHFFWPTQNDDDDNEQGNDDEVQVEVEYMGVDSKQIFHGTEFMGTLLAVGRVLHSETPVLARHNHQARAHQATTSRDCFEILTWFRQHNHTTEWKSTPKICRAQGCFDLVEIGNFCIFVTLAPNDDNQDETDNDAQEWSRNERSSKVFVYPLLDYDPSKLDPVQDNDNIEEEEPSMTYFPQPTGRLDCNGGVTAMAACATGDHLVTFTQQGKLLVWKRAGESFILQQETRFLKALKRVVGKDRWSPHFQAETRSPVISICCPPGAPIELCGFCTLHRSRRRGSTIFFWHHHHGDKANGGKKWRVESMIQLPLNAHRIPKVHYDGRRLVVFGQDHIGLILLVYEVAGTREQLTTYQRETTSSLGQQLDGNVCDLTETKRIRFVSRIRHAALDGVEDYENLYMSCNERYIVVNTKTGHMLSEGAQPFREGLLVIDLNDQPF